MATLTRKLLSSYDSRLATLEGAAYDYASGRVSAFLAEFPKATAEQVREFAIGAVDAAVSAYGDGASGISAELYEGMAEAAGRRVKSALIDTSDVSSCASGSPGTRRASPRRAARRRRTRSSAVPTRP